jgi:hypothetical protein
MMGGGGGRVLGLGFQFSVVRLVSVLGFECASQIAVLPKAFRAFNGGPD